MLAHHGNARKLVGHATFSVEQAIIPQAKDGGGISLFLRGFSVPAAQCFSDRATPVRGGPKSERPPVVEIIMSRCRDLVSLAQDRSSVTIHLLVRAFNGLLQRSRTLRKCDHTPLVIDEIAVQYARNPPQVRGVRGHGRVSRPSRRQCRRRTWRR